MKIILFQPEIPQNTGNIIRTCNVTNTDLVLVRPLGFSTSQRQFKRAGLDYHLDVKISEIDDLESFIKEQNVPFYFFSSKATKSYTEETFSKDALLIFGSETKGFPQEFFEKWPFNFLTIPMKPSSRCLNLSNAAAIVVYEALRQQNFAF